MATAPSGGPPRAPARGSCPLECPGLPTPDTIPSLCGHASCPFATLGCSRGLSPRSAIRPRAAPATAVVRQHAISGAHRQHRQRLLFFRGRGEVRLRGCLCQDSSHHAVGHLRKGAMNILFHVRKLAGVLLQRLQPSFWICLETLPNLHEHRVDAGNRDPFLAFHANLHDIRPPCGKQPILVAFQKRSMVSSFEIRITLFREWTPSYSLL